MLQAEIELDECWVRLGKESFGRLAVATDSGVDIFPINFIVHDRALFFRTAAGSKLVDLSVQSAVAFEIDGHDSNTRWSVVVKGEAKRLYDDAEIEASGVLSLHTASPTAKWNFVRISPASVTGRQFSLLDGLSLPRAAHSL